MIALSTKIRAILTDVTQAKPREDAGNVMQKQGDSTSSRLGLHPTSS